MKGGAGKHKTRPTLGDLASDLMEQWKAAKAGGNAGSFEAMQETAPLQRKQAGEQRKKGGPEVRVTKGKSIGFARRRDETAALPKGNTAPPVSTKAANVHLHSQQSQASKAVPVPVEKNLRQRLHEASADVRALKISGAMSRSKGAASLATVVEDKEGKLAILGLDFGTAFTKAVVRFSGRHYAVDWSASVEGEDHHLLASIFSEARDGSCVLGAREGGGWTLREGIKLQLLSSESAAIDEHLADAVIFIALAFRYTDAWLRRSNPEAAKGIRWSLHVGLPTKSWDDDGTTAIFKTVAQAARVLACESGPVTRVAAFSALQNTDQVDRPAVDVFPEFACQLYSYLLSPERRDDLHALVDIGAGTMDVAYFNVFLKDDEAVLPIFASEVEKLGVHYLIAALAGPGVCGGWADGESALSDEEVATKVGCEPSDVSRRRSLYLSAVADIFNAATRTAKKCYPTSPAFQRGESVRLFLCGGGSRNSSLLERFQRIAGEAATIIGIKFHVSELVRPRDIVGKIGSNFDRLSVAYGLSQYAANIGQVMRSATLIPLMPRERPSEKHRDDER